MTAMRDIRACTICGDTWSCPDTTPPDTPHDVVACRDALAHHVRVLKRAVNEHTALEVVWRERAERRAERIKELEAQLAVARKGLGMIRMNYTEKAMIAKDTLEAMDDAKE